MAKIENIKSGINTTKERLMKAADELREIGAVREASTLETIILKLEIWQNK